MLGIAKKGDLEQLRSMIREMEIPDYESWFTKNFGQEKGESWAEPYGRWLTRNGIARASISPSSRQQNIP